MDLNRKQTAKILWDSAWEQRKCFPCQGDWSRCFTHGAKIVYNFQIKQRRDDREIWCKYSN